MEEVEQKAKTLECPKCGSHRIVREKKSRKRHYFLAAAVALIFVPMLMRDEYVYRCKDCGWKDHFMPE